MRPTLPLRLLIAAAASLLLAGLLLVVLYATELGFQVWERLRSAPAWFMTIYGTGLILAALAGAWLVWRVVFPRRRRVARKPEEPLSEEALDRRLEKAAAAGVATEDATRELDELRARRAAGVVHVALFGQVSTGKSSIVNALLPDARPQISPRGGTTRAITRYAWESPAGDRLVLTDMPGLNEADGTLDTMSREEALRAHIVIYLVDGDLTRDQYQELRAVLGLGKPVILALNKADLYSTDELARIRARLTERVQEAQDVEVVPVSSATRRELGRVHADGREDTVVREVPPRVEELTAALQRRIDEGADTLDQLRDASVFVLTRRKLDAVLTVHRREKARTLTADYTRRAVIGGMAAISPGSDLVIQGYLGIRLVRGLCELYEVPAKDIDVEHFLKLAARRGGKTVPLILAVAGNALKAFPGIGTVTGGLAHAVAYGLLFDSLGRAIAQTLDSRGELPTGVTLRTFEETLSEDLEARARSLARLALEKGRDDGERADQS